MKTEIKNRYRSFKVVYLGGDDNKPARIKITDLRYSKSIIVNYTAKGKPHGTDRAIEALAALGIEIEAISWAEDRNSIFLYDILLTNDFTTQIK